MPSKKTLRVDALSRVSMEPIRTTQITTPLGNIRAGVYKDKLCLLDFEEPGKESSSLAKLERPLASPSLAFPSIEEEHPLFRSLRAQLGEYFAGTRKSFDLPLFFPGTDFQGRVWEGLRKIPYGARWSYADLARSIGLRAGSSRAVGQANGRNPIGIIIPCHRVIAADGGIGGYSGGLWRKQALLDLEAGHP